MMVRRYDPEAYNQQQASGDLVAHNFFTEVMQLTSRLTTSLAPSSASTAVCSLEGCKFCCAGFDRHGCQ